MEVTLVIAFVAGVLIGASPCILLMLSSFGTSFLLIEEKSKFVIICAGLLSGMVSAYLFISVLFLFFVELLDIFSFFKYIFAGILICIGLWQIIESKKEHSTIFGTPQKVKTVLKTFIEKNSGLYAFLVGIIFVFIKIPCFGSIYLALLYNIRHNPLLYTYIIIYLIGMIIPILIIFLLLRLGLESEKVSEFRLENRAKLRILSGAVLIFLAIYLLFLDDLITHALA